MLIDARSLPSGHRHTSQICIIGAGAAGITIARRLAARGLDVLLLESGGFAPDARTQTLYEGPAQGTVLSSPSDYLAVSRLRYVGGTTNHWGGMCRPLDAIDFEKRPWVPESGWPIAERDVAAYYDEAAQVLQLRPFDLEAERQPGNVPSIFPPSSAFEARHFHYSPPTRFREVYGDDLRRSPRITLVTGANVTEIVLQPDGGSVSELKLSTLDGRTSTASARHYVLACGAIENARLLLASNGVQQHGIGNAHDLVGRYFADHPHLGLVGAFTLHAEPWRSNAAAWQKLARAFDGDDERRTLVLWPSPAAQERLGMLNAAFSVNAHQRGRTRIERRIFGALDAVRALADGREPSPEENPSLPAGGRLYVRTEMAPNPENRVTLSDERDALGNRRAALTWYFGDAERRTVDGMLRLLATELGRLGLGRAATHLEVDHDWPRTTAGSHHMGTTRMSSTPSTGVVDTNCRVHGVANLYVAGSSVFPTPGYVNPTFTIVSLALRLADQLGGAAGGN
ncbi:MAG TPA: GMC family oxidoreductase [Vicinamibacterales bacterium]